MVLYSQLGEAFTMDAQDWRNLLDVAARHGWVAAGTAPPPVNLDLIGGKEAIGTWEPLSYLPQGQVVRGSDAKALAAALETAAGCPSRLTRFLAACRRGGFLICREAAGEAEAALDLGRLEAALRESGVPVRQEIAASDR